MSVFGEYLAHTIGVCQSYTIAEQALQDWSAEIYEQHLSKTN